MCGIAGIVRFAPGDAPDRSRVARMCDVLAHRGPDGEGIRVNGRAALGHRRLAIVDVAGGAQPMAGPEAATSVTFNGEIYNHARVRQRLEREGARYVGRSDTECILQLYARYGDACVDYLQGMFAFALWDGARQRLLLARDRIGIKPLYYAYDRDEILFASEIKALLAAGWSARVNEPLLPELLANRYLAGGKTLYEGIEALPPGHFLTWSEPEGVRVQRYWWLPSELESTQASLEECARELRAALSDAIRAHLMSDVPLGLFLSGGLDSSGLAALARPMLDEPLRTFSVGYDAPEGNELPWARFAAEALGAVHREVVVSADDFFGALPRLIWHEDEPIAFPSSVPLYFVSRLASEQVKVVLTGEGADELFLGYNRYRVTSWNARAAALLTAALPAALRAELRALAGRMPLGRYVRRSFLALDGGPRSLFCENFATFSEPRLERLLVKSELLAARDVHAEALRFFAAGPDDLLARLSAADLQTYMVELLMKQDQMSMAASLESRVPYLDHALVERVARLPSRYKLAGWKTKVVLRKALEGDLPPPLLSRRKMGFPTPLGVWLRGSHRGLLRDLTLSERARSRGLFHHEEVARLVDEHERGAAEHTERLWLLINLELWLRQVADGEVPEPLR